MKVQNRLAEIRKARAIPAAELARRVAVSRQTIYAIEAGTYVPNTEVALHLARELQVTVDELFSLPPVPAPTPQSLAVQVLSSTPTRLGQPVRLCQVGSEWVAVPANATPYYLPQADAVMGRAGATVIFKDETPAHSLVLAGCDPATSLLTHMVQQISGVEVVSAAASSRLALAWLKQGKVHIAGSHLEDARTGEFNLPYLSKEFPNEEMVVITFARWEEGLITLPGNSKSIHKIEDLGRKSVRFVNREPGSGSRALLDKLIKRSGLTPAQIHGYDRVAFGHLAAAYHGASGDADVCLATRSAAQAFGLDFTPLHSERYDLVMRKETASLPMVQAFLDVLQRATLRRKLEILAGYDTAQTGALVS